MRTTLIRWSGLLALLGASFQLLVTVPGTLVSYWTNRGFVQDPAEALGLAKLWSPLAADLLRPLLFFQEPQAVYHMYDGLWTLAVPFLIAGLVGLFHMRRQQGGSMGRLEWAGYLVSSLGLTMLVIGNGSEAWFGYLDWFGITDFVFTALALPGLLLILLGATLLGAGLLKSGQVGRTAAWLLVLGGMPGGAIVGLFVIGHLFGFVALIDVAWMILGAALWNTGRVDDVSQKPASARRGLKVDSQQA